MNSEERRAARRKRRDEQRAAKKAARAEGCDLESMADMNALYKAQREAARGVGWKASTQRYQINWLLNINRMRRDLLQGKDVHRGFHEFDIVERGKRRHISSVHFSERVPQKSLSQNVLIPLLKPSLIDRNAANIKGRGVSYSLKALKRDLVRHYRKHGRDGYILLIDFADYFASIDHGAVKDMIRASVEDPGARDLALRFVDVQGERGLGLGSEPNQIEAVSLPNPIDHYVNEMLRVEAYGRYMDDSYMIHESKQYLRVCLALVREKCSELGITVNERKTRIVKLSRGFTFLKKRVFYGENGKVVMRPCRDSITRERRKLKKMKRMVDAGIMDVEDVERSYQSWRGSLSGLDAHGTMLSMDALYRSLFKITEDPPTTDFYNPGVFGTPRKRGFSLGGQIGTERDS